MTVEELLEEMAAQPQQGQSSYLPLPLRKPIGFLGPMRQECGAGGDIFTEVDGMGRVVFMTLTEDGRKVPLDDW